jgi:hypothetical protein
MGVYSNIMTNKEINQAIEEYCLIGWIEDDDEITEIHIPVNYCDDLNAMHEAEKFLEGSHNWNKYTDILGKLCLYKPELHGLRTFVNIIVSASSRQRAESFVKTIGKWTGQEPIG